MTKTLDLHASLCRKLHPQNFTAMSGKMAAVLGCVLSVDWTDPRITALCITADGFLMAQEEGDIGFNAILGSASDLERNLENLFAVAGITPAERQQWARCRRACIRQW